MESNPNEDDSKSSREEEEETGHDHLGTGRSYECVFCKRGFTTAQALGGHMNIHRKDRAKNRPQIIDDNNKKYYASFRSFDPTVQSNPTTHNHPHQYLATTASEVHINYQTYFPTSTNNNYDSYENNHAQHLNLGLRVGESHHHRVAAVHDKEKRQGISEDEEEIDLELRLGHHHDP